MSRALPPLDFHAHIDLDIAPRELESLGAVVFVATRSLADFERIAARTDAVTIWGVGCHPGVAAAIGSFDNDEFIRLVTTTPFVSEVGLDGRSRVPIEQQASVFASVLQQVARTPRLVSVHSKRATKGTLDLIEESGVRHVILHWWLGSEAETRRALNLGCLFSVNGSMDVSKLQGAGVPLTALLPETDHPFGNRRGAGLKQPGWTSDVEAAVAASYGTTPEAVRKEFWRTFLRLVGASDTRSLFPPVVQAMLSQTEASSV